MDGQEQVSTLEPGLEEVLCITSMGVLLSIIEPSDTSFWMSVEVLPNHETLATGRASSHCAFQVAIRTARITSSPFTVPGNRYQDKVISTTAIPQTSRIASNILITSLAGLAS
jgi:hypothetical protein